jgi:toxin ParE1/3/4
MRRLVFRSQARRDILDLIDAIATAADPDTAERFAGSLLERLRGWASNPATLGSVRDELTEGLRAMPHKRHVVFFRYLPGKLEVVRIVHAARDVDTLPFD